MFFILLYTYVYQKKVYYISIKSVGMLFISSIRQSRASYLGIFSSSHAFFLFYPDGEFPDNINGSPYEL